MAANGTTEWRVEIADIPLGGMKQVERDDAKVLFVRDAAGVRAFEAECPHYGAPLADGAVCGTTLYCPWHKAAFDIGDGALRQPPALRALHRYAVRLDGDEAIASGLPLPPEQAEKRMGDKHFVIVGTGAAAVAAATTLRHKGFAGRLTMIGRETGEPYDRTALSKKFLAKPTPVSDVVPEPDFFAANDIDVVVGQATAIDPVARRVSLADGRTLDADALLVATGSRAARSSLPGIDLANVFTLRSLADAVALSERAVKGKRLVLIGAGFIGLEAAAFLTKRGLEATVVTPDALPLASRFGDDVGEAIKTYHAGNGIRFVQGSVARIAGTSAAEKVELDDGTALDADLVLVGIGAKPETDAIQGVRRRDDGGIEVDTDLRIAPGTWLAGDIAAFPDPRSGARARIEHWRLAEQHGIHAAHGMLGRVAPFEAAPFFWTNQGDKRVDYAGYAPDWDEIVTHGEAAKLDFISYYIKDGRTLAACAIGRSAALIAFLDRIETGPNPRVADLGA